MRAEALSVARFESTIENAVGGDALLDLVFCDGKSFAILPYVRVQGAFLVERERTPIVWPTAARGLGYDILDGLENKLLPWLQSLVLARQENGEVIRSFGDERAREVFDAARDAGFLGAARYADVLPALAPYVYARRFSAHRTVGVYDARGASGAAMLQANSACVRADLCSSEGNAFARAWFGCDIFASLDDEYDVTVTTAATQLRGRVASIVLDVQEPNWRHVEIAAAVPSDVMISYDPDDAPVVRAFSARAAGALHLRESVADAVPVAVGGSSGTLLLLLREDFERNPDADTDDAYSLASRLRAEGFTVELATPSGIRTGQRPDLVHAMGAADLTVSRALQGFRRVSVPSVITPYSSAAPQESVWGPQILAAAWTRARDEGLLEEYLDLIALRKLQADHVPTPAPASAALQNADAALAASAAEEAQLRELGFRGQIVRYSPKPAPPRIEPAEVASLVGDAPFVFVHGPVEWRTNLPLLARVATARGIPIVVAGPVADSRALRAAAEQGPELVVYAPGLNDAEIEALYRAARVYTDLSWASRGLARVARAAANGCSLLLSSHLLAAELFPAAAQADPGSLTEIGAALQAAWDAAQPAPTMLNGPDLFSAAIFAYSKAIAARQPA